MDANPLSDATQKCLDQGLLELANSGSTKLSNIGNYGTKTITVRLQLPSNVACQHCVFQWKYTTGNNWGKDPVTGEEGLGLGIENETFMGCADITIIGNKARSLSGKKSAKRRHFNSHFFD